MRTLLIGVLAATLVGCSCLLPPQASMEACTDTSGSGCLNGMAASRPIEPAPTSSKTNSATTKAKSTIATKTEKPSVADVRDRPQPAEKRTKSTTIEAKVEAPGRPAETSDPVMIKAKTTIAAKLEDPASAEFGEMKRAIRKNTLGKSIDTICGRVKGKDASGEDTGDRPFLYLVMEDEAYVVNGSANSAAASAYRNICS
ncbi:hypothetical protein V1292_006249 [Bradyrhizobium sp. AZCC 1719]|uniref:hypothetical protein n=1 Tax=Bradyrhizobium sp. AZCC 1719 TaxID=3117028 RepID=UPI002FF10E38